MLAVFTGVELGSHGVLAAALGAYATLVTAEAAIIGWDTLRVRAARRRIEAIRASRRR